MEKPGNWPSLNQAHEWEGEFLACCKADSTARRAWAELEGAGLDGPAKILLFQFTEMKRNVISEVLSGNRRVVHNLEATARAVRTAEERSGDPREKMFVDRREEAVQTAAKVPWPFRNPSVPTLADALVCYPQLGEKDIEDLPGEARRRGEMVRRYDGKELLLVLCDYAARNGVKLSLGRLVALADCAAPYREGEPSLKLDKRTLGRFFSLQEVKDSASKYLSAFDDFLSQPPSATTPRRS